MEETSRKRARLEQEMSDNETSLTDAAIATVPTVTIPPTRDAEYWFEDGNIILVAQNVSFKVYKGLLAEHSAVFRSMFLVAQGSQASTDLSTDGCPVVTLDDSPEDLRKFFRLIYPMSTNFKSVWHS
ncbi:hypothetical protein NUW54_g12579 [Trametes sanguinea]|uniref:Uncharacterized protein n=1 Tax=Trametes sanguinea TaxID=158606 RepID=A0ACC1MVS3_9APHY|nr:hypothetical protein NUW54_g12579 [Trametes sanguinea]